MRIRNRKLRRSPKNLVRNIIIVMVFSTLILVTGYSAFSTNIILNTKGNIKEKSRIIKARDETAFWAESYRTNIASITFLNTRKVPSDVVQKWDVSKDGKGGVVAYVQIDEEDNTKYDLFIGANGGVIANENSNAFFRNFSNTKEINFNNNFDTSNVKSMADMFGGNSKWELLDLSGFDTSKVTNMGGMFTRWDGTRAAWGTSNLSEIIFGENFVTNQVTDMHDMFSGTSVTSLDLSNFNTSNVVTMFHMFVACENLTILDLSSFDTANVTNMPSMFSNCSSLKTVYVSDKFVVSQVTNSSSMFYLSLNLVGGNGTKYDDNHIDKEYARIDTSDTPGYFTLKQ